MLYYVYILKTNRRPFYVGMTSDPQQRLKSHYHGAGITNPIVRYYLSCGALTYMHIAYCFSKKADALVCEYLINQKISNKWQVANCTKGNPIKVPKINDVRIRMPENAISHLRSQLDKKAFPQCALVMGRYPWVRIFVDIVNIKIINI